MGLQLIPAELILEQELPAAQTIYQLGLSNRLQLRQMANITVQSTIRRYQKATTKIQKKILAIGNSSEARVGRLSGLLGEIEKEIRILNEGIIRDIESTAERALRESVRQAAQNAGPFAQAVRGPLTGASPTSMQGQFNILVNQVEKAFRAVPKGIQLSDRIWNTHSITLSKMRNLMVNGYLEGLTSNELARQIRGFLHLPNVDMRRNVWKQFFKDNPPGPGMYKSAAKNTERVIRTEVNRAYRLGTTAYASNKEWVQAVKWNLVPAHECCDICNEIATFNDGLYDPAEVPDTPHPNCLCFLTIEPKPEFVNELLLDTSHRGDILLG